MIPLDHWLADATRGLSTESAVRVRKEIQQHYDLACEAGDDAIAALGNPRTANRAYRKVLLTEQEAMLAPSFTQPRRPSLAHLLLTSAMIAMFTWFFSRMQHGPGLWPVVIAICGGQTLARFFLPTTLAQCRIYSYVLGLHSLLVAGVAWWYYGWSVALPMGTIMFVFGYFLNHKRQAIFRKLAGGQTYLLLPEQRRLTHAEAMTLYTLDKEPDFPEKLASTILLMIAAAMAIWQPTSFAPMAVFVFAAHVTRRTVPFHTEDGSRWFRIAKWITMVIAALLPVLLKARGPWIGAFYLAFLFVLFDLKSISIRRKLPIAQWPRRLYW